MGEQKYIKKAVGMACFHGESWYRCPHCGTAFEYWNAFYEDKGIKRTDDEHIFKCSCGELFKIA